ncbi:MAG: FtsW/RodA/SpoVE family cell cycle protein [Candidatus Spyradenecus sp.]
MKEAFEAFWQKTCRLNWAVLGAALVLAGAGVMFVRSACSSRATEALRQLWVGQLEFVGWGALLMVVLAYWDYRRWARVSGWVYMGVLAALVLVLVPGIGVARLGARRWLFGLQPSEPAKLAVILMLSWVLSRWGAGMRGARGLLVCGVLAGVPAVLILAEPDLGTALVLGPTVLAMLFAARVCPKVLGVGVLLVALAVGYELTLVKVAKAEGVDPARAERLIRWTGLREHQVRRVETFLYPMRDLHANGYNAYQSEIAVGSGGMTGKGYGRGVQHRLGYLPPVVSMNDFIFPVVAEETGFAGSAALLGLYLFGILVPGSIIALRCRDDLGRLLCVGVLTLLFCHVFINIGMTVRIVPITGLPLPFISQGGTFMLVMMASMGVLQSVAIHGRISEAVFRH